MTNLAFTSELLQAESDREVELLHGARLNAAGQSHESLAGHIADDEVVNEQHHERCNRSHDNVVHDGVREIRQCRDGAQSS